MTGNAAEMPTMSREAGFSLIEVMIALVIIAVGMLGVAGIMALSMNNDDASRLQSLAALQAASMATAMQANKAYWVSGAGATISQTAPNTSSTLCNGAVCNAANMATEDLSNWGYSLAQTLPNGSGTVSCAAAPQPTATSPAATWCTITVN
jgi:type IV pilus assembly protein PilV